VAHELQLSSGISTTFDCNLQWTPEEATRQHQIWTLSNGLRDAIEGVSYFLESSHRVLSVWSLAERQQSGVQLQFSDWRTAMKGTSFHRLGFPDKLSHMQSEHGIALDKDLARQVVSVNAARNCLVHRRGIVEDRDLNDGDLLTVEWRKLRTLLVDEDGEHELVIGQRIEKESSVCIRVVDDKKSFKRGEQVAFTAQEFSDVTWGMFAFGSDVVRAIGAVGLSKGFVTPVPNPQGNQPD
jgi:hypothetical protein